MEAVKRCMGLATMMRCFLLTVLLLIPAAAAAVDDDWSHRGRELAFERTATGGVFTSTSGNDRIEVRVDAPRARLAYSFTDDDGTRRLEQQTVALVEWQDMDGDARYTMADRTVHRAPIEGTAHTVQSQATPDGHAITIEYTILGPSDALEEPVQRGTLRIRVAMVEERAEGASPPDASITTEVENFPFRQPGTNLAIEVRLAGNEPLTRSVGDLGVTLADHATFYAWDDQTTTAGQQPARVTELVRSPRDAASASLFFALAGGDASQDARISTVRLADLMELQGRPLLFAAGGLLMAAVVGVPTFLRMRGRP